MAETAANAYATTSGNAAAGAPNTVAVDVDTAGYQRQVVQIGDKTSNNVTVHPAGFLRVTDEPRQLFYDPFDAALDTTNLWTTPTVGNSAVIASATSGQLSMGTGTTASGWSKLTSQATFRPSVPSWLGFSFAIALPDGAAPTANSYRFWGSGSIPGVPTTAAPLTDAVGFEMTTAGHLCAVVYAGGVRTLIADLNGGKQPTDANQHRYVVYVRTDRSYWYIDGLDGASLVATSNFQAPNVQTLTATLLAVGGSTPPASNSQIQCNGAAVWDKGKNSTQLSDGLYPWRKQTVKAASTAAASTDLPAVVALHPSSPLPAGTNTIGNVGSMGTTLNATPTGVGALNADVIPSVDVSAYKAVMYQITGTWVGTLTPQGSNDNVTWSTLISYDIQGDGTTNAITGNNVYQQTVFTRYFRLRFTAYTSGTATALYTLSSTPPAFFVKNINAGGLGAVAGTVASFDSVPVAGADGGGLKRHLLVDTGGRPQDNVAQINGITPLMGNGVTGTGSLRVTLASDNTANTNPFLMEERTHTAGGATTFTLISAATTNATSVKASAGTLYSVQATNTGAAVAFLKIFNLAAAPTVGTSVAAKTLIIPAGGGTNIQFAGGIGAAFGTGISISITGVATTADTTAVALAQVVVNIDFA